MPVTHVALLFEFSSLNGGERSMLAVLRCLQSSQRFRFTAITPPTGLLAEQLAILKIPVVAFECRPQESPRQPADDLIRQLNGICAALQPDVLHANSLSMARLTGSWRECSLITAEGNPASGTRTRTLTNRQPPPDDRLPTDRLPTDRPALTGHLRDIIGLSRKAVRHLNRNDALVAVSHATKRFHMQQGVADQKCQVIYNGVDTDQFSPRDPRQPKGQVVPTGSANSLVLLTAGQICLRKGQLDAAEAVIRLLQTDPDQPVHWVVVGTRHSDKAESIDYERSLTRVFERCGLRSHLHLAGFREDIPRLMQSADMLVHPARQEPFGRVLLEAAASGLPIVATDVGGTCEMLTHQRDAILVQPGNVNQLVQSIRRLMSDAPLRKQLADHARNKMCEHFTIQQAAERLAEFWLHAATFPGH